MRKVVISGMLGNGLEWYDFALYGQMAFIIGRLFFPSESEFVERLAVFGAFAVGFLMRPLGAVLFGYIGDRYGRRTSLVIAILMMAIPTGCIGLLPTFEQIGILAPILLTIIRILQGLSLGGEFSGSIVYIVEHAPPNKRGLAGSASIISLVMGFLLGTLVSLATVKLLPEEDFISWGWRLPFLFGIVIGLVGFYIRKACEESPTFETAREEGHLSQTPVREAFGKHWKEMLISFGIYITVTVPFYASAIYFITYSKVYLGHSTEDTFLINLTAMFGMMCGMFFGSLLSDRIGRKAVMVPCAVIILLMVWPLFALMDGSSVTSTLLWQLAFATAIGFYISPVPALLVELFPTSVRYTGLAIAYNVCAAALGGTTPMVAEWLINVTGTVQSVSVYLMVCCVLSLVALASYRDRWKESLR